MYLNTNCIKIYPLYGRRRIAKTKQFLVMISLMQNYLSSLICNICVIEWTNLTRLIDITLQMLPYNQCHCLKFLKKCILINQCHCEIVDSLSFGKLALCVNSLILNIIICVYQIGNDVNPWIRFDICNHCMTFVIKTNKRWEPNIYKCFFVTIISLDMSISTGNRLRILNSVYRVLFRYM